MSEPKSCFSVSLWNIFHIPVFLQLGLTSYIYYYDESTVSECMIFINCFQLLMWFLCHPSDFSLVNFWFVFFSQLYHVIFALIFIIVHLDDIIKFKDDYFKGIYVIISLLYFTWIMLCLNVLYMEYTPYQDGDHFLKIRYGFNYCNFKIDSSILPKFNKIHPYRCYNTTKIYIKSI